MPESKETVSQETASFMVAGQVVDIPNRRIYAGEVHVAGGLVEKIVEVEEAPPTYLMPGFVDAHVHIESSMLTPVEFARAASVHGTVATVSDPHEIGNVLGIEGVRFMMQNAESTPMKLCFGAPSCVPATPFETAGAGISVAEVEELLDDPRVLYLSEMMNFPGVLNGDPDCMAKIQAALSRGKQVDGHAPGLRGDEAARYISAGITTDHECFTEDEARDKLAHGCKIAIREGSAARNFEALYKLIGEFPGMTMLCSDDKHPDELVLGHIDALVRRALAGGIQLFDVLEAACVTPVLHYGLPVGLLRKGDAADFIEVDSITEPRTLRTWVNGELIAEAGKTHLASIDTDAINQFVARQVPTEELMVERPQKTAKLKVIEAEDGQLVTGSSEIDVPESSGPVSSMPEQDVLKLVVVNRYAEAPAAVAFIKNFGIKRGAIASSVAHDSHNVIAVGVSDDDLADAINAVMNTGGGLSACCREESVNEVLPLPVAGLMATGDCQTVGDAYGKLDQLAKAWGSTLRSPYMTLSFMALLVIPALKLSDKGLFNGGRFEFTSLWAE